MRGSVAPHSASSVKLFSFFSFFDTDVTENPGRPGGKGMLASEPIDLALKTPHELNIFSHSSRFVRINKCTPLFFFFF